MATQAFGFRSHRCRASMSAVRFRINADKSATLAGVHYQDLRGVLDAAAIHYYEDLRKLRAKKRPSARDREMLEYVTGMLQVLETTRLAVSAGIAATYPKYDRAFTPAERLEAIKAERNERVMIDALIDAAIAQRAKRA